MPATFRVDLPGLLDGGFPDRAGKSDLYYTSFGLAGLASLVEEPKTEVYSELERARRYLVTFGEGEGLDFVHLCCLARSWGVVSGLIGSADFQGVVAPILRGIEAYRAADGGYNLKLSARGGSAYGAFLACSAYEGVGWMPPAPAATNGRGTSSRIWMPS